MLRPFHKTLSAAILAMLLSSGGAFEAGAQVSAVAKAIGKAAVKDSDDVARTTARTANAPRTGSVGPLSVSTEAVATARLRILRDLTPKSNKASAHRTQWSLVTANIHLEANFVKAEAKGQISLGDIFIFTLATGFSSSGSQTVDDKVHIEIAANALAGNKDFYPLVCLDGNYIYLVPSNSVVCLDGRLPMTTNAPISLRPLPVQPL